MEEMLSIVQTISSTEDTHGHLAQLYAMLDEHQSFQLKASHELDPIVSHISNLLNDAVTRHQGLLLLHQFLPQCPLDIIEQKGALWTTLTTKICALQRPVDAASVPLALRTLAHLLHKSVHVPELSKALSNTLLAKIAEALLHLPPTAHRGGLRLLEQAQRLYPGASCLGRAATEQWICSFVDSPNAELVRQAGRCLHLLQQTRGGGTAGAQHRVAWSGLQQTLLGQLHQLLDALYANTPEVLDAFVAGADCPTLALPELLLSDEPVARIAALAQRFCNLTEWLRTALVSPYPVPKAVLPAKLLSLIARGLAVNCATLASNLIVDNIVVGALLPAVHTALFRLLDGLILTCGTNLLMYGQHVLQLVLQALQWTSSGRAAGRCRPFAAVRLAAYDTLRLWTRTARGACGAERIAEQLVPLCVQDVTPFQQEVRLKVLSGARRHMSKKARRNLHRAQNDASNLAQAHSHAFDAHNTKVLLSDAGNEALCAGALRALTAVLLAVGQFVKPVVHRLLQEHLVGVAVQVRLQQSGASAAVTGTLYASAECRTELYTALEALVLGGHHLCPAPVQYVREVCAAAQARDASAAVRERCAQIGRLVERVVHPQRETLQFPVEATLQRDALKELKQLGKRGGEVESDAEESDEEEVDADEKIKVDDQPVAVDQEEDAVAMITEEAAEQPEPDVVEDHTDNDNVDDDLLHPDDVLALETSGSDEAAQTETTAEEESEPNIAPRQREKRAADATDGDDDAVAATDGKRAKAAEVVSVPKVVSVAAMAENAAAEAIVEDLMAEFVNELNEEDF